MFIPLLFLILSSFFGGSNDPFFSPNYFETCFPPRPFRISLSLSRLSPLPSFFFSPLLTDKADDQRFFSPPLPLGIVGVVILEYAVLPRFSLFGLHYDNKLISVLTILPPPLPGLSGCNGRSFSPSLPFFFPLTPMGQIALPPQSIYKS